MISTKPSRYPVRGTDKKETLYQIVDEGLFCTVAFVRDGVACQIPTGFCRMGDDLYIHASSKSHFINDIIGNEVSYSVTLMDALVLAPTAFDHSFNYRSVVGFAVAAEVTDPEEKRTLFCAFTDRYIPGRIADVGEPELKQVEITKIVKLSLQNAAAKARSGDVNVKLSSEDSWCGVIPLHRSYGPPQIDEQLPSEKKLPDYIASLIHGPGGA